MEILFTSVLAFVSTNLDDIFLLMLFYGNKQFKGNEIITGQFLGIISLIGISLIGSLVGLFIDPAYIGLLGLAPVYLGAKGIWKLFRSQEEDEHSINQNKEQRKSNVLTVASVTIANGGDNIGIYIPLFATLSWSGKTTMISIFLVMTFLWCLAANYLTRHPYVARILEKYGHVITPFVLVLLGLYILYESNTLLIFVK